MSAPLSIDWRGPGCSDACRPRQHDPLSHEDYGRLLERWETQPRIVRTGVLTVDLHARRVLVSGIETYVSGREWAVLAYLAVRVGRYCACEDILAAIWGDADVARCPDLRPLHATLDRLRKRLGPAGHLITSLMGRGRRLELVPPLEPGVQGESL